MSGLFSNQNDGPFYNSNTLPNINVLIIGDSVNYIPPRCFYNCVGIDSLYLGNNIGIIDEYAFYNCNLREKLVLPDLITDIGQFAFGGWNDIDTLYIGSNLINVGSNAFFSCNHIKYLYYNTPYIPLSLQNGQGMLPSYDSIEILIIGDDVVDIPNKSLFGCIKIDSIHIGASVHSIGDSAFWGCNNINSIVFSGVISIGKKAFANCTSINSIFIPDAVTSIGEAAFQGCSSISNLQIGSGITSIADSTFYGCSSIGSITIPSGVTSIGNSAFKGCVAANSLSLGMGVIHVGNNAFSECDNILTANINAQYIGKEAFANCDRLVTVTLGDSVNTLSRGAFKGCFRLQNFTFGNGIDTIPSGIFSGCVRLENMQLGGGIRHIGDSAFYNCSLIHDIVLPEGLTSIGNYAFYGCSGISGMLEFPSTISTIGNNAFRSIGSVNRIRMNGTTPPTIYANTFYSVSNSTPVEVPCGSVLNYYTTNYWENFSNIVEAPPFRLNVTSNNTVMGTATVTQQPTCTNHTALIQASANSGYHFLQWNDGNTGNPRQLQLTSDTAFEAVFVVNYSYISVESNDPLMGSVTGTGTYNYNAPVTLTATANDGYHFLKWNDGNTQNPRYLAATRDSSFTAIFVSNVSTITVANANPDMGNVSGSGVYYYQNLVSISATPVYGYHFSQWNDGNTQNPRTIVINQDSAFTAYFAPNTYSIVGTSNSTTMGSVSGGGNYTYLHEMSLTATPAFGYHFVQWNDQITDNPRTITVTRDSAFTAQFAANSYTLTAEPNDPTMGSAYGSGTYNFNTTATMTAVAEYGYHFTQWSDGVTDNPRTVTVQNSATYTAQFEINSYIITVQSSNPAIGTTSGGGSYNYLTPVNISANPNAGYHFTQWSDGNTDNPRLVTVTQNATYTAQFAINSYAVGVASSNSNMGSVSGSGTYNHNSTATLTATAYYGYHFVQWQDGNTDNPRSVVVTDSAQYTAQFDYNSYLVTANSSNVTLGSATGGGSYNYLSQVALTAVAVPHYHFTMWNDSIEDNPRTITVTRDTTLTAHFAIDRHTLGVNSADATMGSASGSDTVNYNTAVWISATANYGYHFTHWNDGNSSNPRRVVVSQDVVYTASFAPNQYSATCAVNNNSRGTVATTGGNYSYLTSVTFTAIPNSNYHFLRWSNGSTENPVTFTLTQDTVLTAILVGITANVNDNTMGTVSHSKPSNLVEVVTATPNYGYHFVQWNDGITDNPRTMNLVGDTTLTAFFAVNNYYVALGVNDESLGSVEGEDEYPYLSTVTITATAAEHSHFLQWSDGNTTNPRMLTVTRDTSLMAYFALDQQFQITVNSNDTTMGSVEGSGTYFIGETVTITATANEHYYFSQWSDGVTSNPRVVTVTGDMTYTAVFEPVMYTLTVAANDYSMGQVTGGGSYAYGTEVTIEARAFGGYRFLGWNDGVMDEQRTVMVTENASYTAMFEPSVGIEDVEAASYKMYVSNGHIVVEGVEDKRVQVYDLTGRKHPLSEQLPTGVYLVRIDNAVTQKVVVM